MSACPRTERFYGLPQGAAELGQLVIHTLGRCWVDGSRHEAISLQATQREREHPLRNTADHPLDLVETLWAIAEQHDLWVISDECYDELVFEGRHVSTATLGRPDRVISVFTFSKSYAMTGWRVGYVVAPAGFSGQYTRAGMSPSGPGMVSSSMPATSWSTGG